MSGYCSKCGVYEITATKLSYYFRRSDLKTLFQGKEMVYPVDVLREYGYQIIFDGGSYLRVRATPAQVWEALSGLPSTPGHYESRNNSCPCLKKREMLPDHSPLTSQKPKGGKKPDAKA